MSLFLAQLEQGVNLVDKAAQASDRWLFLALLTLVLVCAGYIIRQLLKERVEHLEWMKTVYVENIKLTAQVLVALQENNRLLESLKSFLSKNDAI